MNLKETIRSLAVELILYKSDQGKYKRLKQEIAKKLLMTTLRLSANQTNHMRFLDELALRHLFFDLQHQLLQLKHNQAGTLDLILEKYTKILNKNILIH